MRMSDAKVEIKVGEIEFSGQGEQDWVAEQLDKILAKAADLIVIAPSPAPASPTPLPSEQPSHEPMTGDATIAGKTLPTFLVEKGAAKNQAKKFLATAVWLEAKGKSRLQTSDITKALKDSNQSRLSNPADCLNKNVAKGYCEKDGKQFFVTQEGKDSL